MGGGAWPFLVGGVICLVNSDNERDLSLLNSYADLGKFLIYNSNFVKKQFGAKLCEISESIGGYAS